MPETVQCAKNTKTKKANAVLLFFNLRQRSQWTMKTTWHVNIWNIQVAIGAYTFPEVLDNLFFFLRKERPIKSSPSQSSLPQPSSFISHNLLNSCYISSSVSGARSHHLSSLLHLCKTGNFPLKKKKNDHSNQLWQRATHSWAGSGTDHTLPS